MLSVDICFTKYINKSVKYQRKGILKMSKNLLNNLKLAQKKTTLFRVGGERKDGHDGCGPRGGEQEVPGHGGRA